MLNRFKKEYLNLFNPNSKMIIAVSGGVDSVVLLDLISKNNSRFAIAHCNFKLRGTESDKDEAFIKRLSKKHHCSFFSKKFKTESYAKEQRISIQMAARNLRYNWFYELLKKNNFDYIALAHHADDQIETILLNLVRGTGLNGLLGMKPIHNKLIRPLLEFTKKDIQEYAVKHSIDFREDSSNKSLKYKRNSLRHKVIPELKKLNPSLVETFRKNIRQVKEPLDLMNEVVNKIQKNVISVEKNRIAINLKKLEKEIYSNLFLFEILSDFGFKDLKEITNSFEKESGKMFYSKTHVLLKDRNKLFIQPNLNNNTIIGYVKKNTKSLSKPLCLSMNKYKERDVSIIQENNKIAMCDYNKLSFPLKIRKWKKGDYFYPLGMKKRKKLSDFFIDKKLSIFAKNDIWLLCSNDDIVWIIGHRLDNRFKVTQNTKEIYQLRLS